MAAGRAAAVLVQSGSERTARDVGMPPLRPRCVKNSRLQERRYECIYVSDHLTVLACR
jgi:hypothetical protein